jgi:hypothetical protein
MGTQASGLTTVTAMIKDSYQKALGR